MATSPDPSSQDERHDASLWLVRQGLIESSDVMQLQQRGSIDQDLLVSKQISSEKIPLPLRILELGESSLMKLGGGQLFNHENNLRVSALASGTGTRIQEHVQPAHDVSAETERMDPRERAPATDHVRPFQDTVLDIQNQASDESSKLGEKYFPWTVQASLSIMTSSFSSGSLSSSPEANFLLHFAAGSNIFGYISCLIEMLLRPGNPKAAKIVERISSAAAVSGFLSMMGTLLSLDPRWITGLATIVSLLFFAAKCQYPYPYTCFLVRISDANNNKEIV